MKAIFEVEFDPNAFANEEEIKEFDNDYFKLMSYLVKEEGLGIFEADLKLVGVKLSKEAKKR